jgi:hypothetical protein
MHHTARDGPFCPIKTLATRVHHLFHIAPDDASLPISFIAPGEHVSSAHITLAVRESVILGGLLNCGYSPSRVSAHSLRPASTTSAKT